MSRSATPGCAERWRIEQGVPRWGRELTHEIIPVEANLEGDAIDYDKGCYIGQEVISRMKMSGQTNKRLCGLVALDGSALSSTMRLFPSAAAGGADPAGNWAGSRARRGAIGWAKKSRSAT